MILNASNFIRSSVKLPETGRLLTRRVVAALPIHWVHSGYLHTVINKTKTLLLLKVELVYKVHQHTLDVYNVIQTMLQKHTNFRTLIMPGQTDNLHW